MKNWLQLNQKKPPESSDWSHSIKLDWPAIGCFTFCCWLFKELESEQRGHEGVELELWILMSMRAINWANRRGRLYHTCHLLFISAVYSINIQKGQSGNEQQLLCAALVSPLPSAFPLFIGYVVRYTSLIII